MKRGINIGALTLLFSILITLSAHSQVTIGMQSAPLQGVLLELKQSDVSADDANSSGGMMLPRVNLSAMSSLDPILQGADATNPSIQIKYAGLIVYNATTTAPFAKGLYSWDGTQWRRMSSVMAENGLVLSVDTIQLGGDLTQSTIVNQNSYNLQFQGAGKFSVGNTSPTANSARFEVDGASANVAAFSAGSSATIDFSKSNLVYTTANAGDFTLQNLKDGATYTLAVQGTASGTSTFNATNTAGATVTCKLLNNSATVSGKDTLYTIIVMGTIAYIYVSPGF